MSSQPNPASETAVTKPTVVPGLGYPAGRNEVSDQPTGWLLDGQETIKIFVENKVSRETF